MDATLKNQEQPVVKWRLPMQLLALVIFLVICIGPTLSVVMKVGAEQSQMFKMTFLILVLCRLAWQIYKHTFRYLDCVIYVVIVIGFCHLVDYEVIRL